MKRLAWSIVLLLGLAGSAFGQQGNQVTPSGSGGCGTVISKTANYTAVAGDSSKTLSFNGANLTYTLLNPPSNSFWAVCVENLNATSLTVSPNGLNLDGSASSVTLSQNQGFTISTDGTNYFTVRGAGGGYPGVTSPGSGSITGSGTAMFNFGSFNSVGENFTDITCAAQSVGNSNQDRLSCDGTNWPVISMNSNAAQKVGLSMGVNAQTVNYAAVQSDCGKIITMNGVSLTLTLPNPIINSGCEFDVKNLAATPLTIARNSLNVDGAAANPANLNQNETLHIKNDGAGYWTNALSVLNVSISGKGHFYGYYGVGAPIGSSTSVGVASANNVYAFMFSLPGTFTVNKIAFFMSVIAAGTCDAGIYDSGGNLLVHIASGTSCNTANVSASASATTVLNPGTYYFAYTASVTTAKFGGYGVDAVETFSESGVFGLAANAASTGVLPATLGVVTNDASQSVPVAGFTP